MNDLERPSDFELEIQIQIETLVRCHLDRESERVDPRAIFERVLTDLPQGKPLRLKARGGRSPWKLATALVAASALIVGFSALFWRDRPVLARGETVVREARQAHQGPVDRCYLVEVRRESSMAAELAPNAPQVRATRLWTRGDRFWVESARVDQRWAWGRDVANRFWIAFGPHAAVRLEADEVPDWLSLYCDLHSLHFDQLLGDVLNRFNLDRDPDDDRSDASTIRVKATPRDLETPSRVPRIEGVEIEIDAETRVIRRMVVRRVFQGEPFATVTFSLLETDILDPSDYQVEGHLSDPSQIFTRDHEPQRRKELLTRWFGARTGRWSQVFERMK